MRTPAPTPTCNICPVHNESRVCAASRAPTNTYRAIKVLADQPRHLCPHYHVRLVSRCTCLRSQVCFRVMRMLLAVSSPVDAG